MAVRLQYASPIPRDEFPWMLIVLLAAYSFSHIACEVIVWFVAFYGFGFKTGGGEQLWERDIFISSILVESAFAVYSWLIISLILSLAWTFRFRLTIWLDVIQMAIAGAIYSLSRWLMDWIFRYEESKGVNLALTLLLPFVLPSFVIFRSRRRECV